jgi:RNA polymerase sigma factor (TIGR02999 family)
MTTQGSPPNLDSDRQVLDQLFTATYEELRRMAAVIRKDDVHTQVSAQSLVNEAWLKLKNSQDLEFKSTLHFKMVAARAMRQILLDAARRRVAQKRGGETTAPITAAEEEIAGSVPGERELLALRSSLDELAKLNPRQSLLVRSRYFGGLAMCEIAARLRVSESTALREWRAAKVWLSSKIRGTW